MTKCYQLETKQEYESVKDCAEQNHLTTAEMSRLYRGLRNNQITKLQGFHYGSSLLQLSELTEWVAPYDELDLEVNRNGQVRKQSTKTIKKLTHDTSGYLYTTLTLPDGTKKAFTVHRLIAKAFLNNFQESLVVDHINGVRDDNRLENLCMKTQSENLQARDENNKPLYDELRRLIIKYGYEETYNILKQF